MATIINCLISGVSLRVARLGWMCLILGLVLTAVEHINASPVPRPQPQKESLPHSMYEFENIYRGK